MAIIIEDQMLESVKRRHAARKTLRTDRYDDLSSLIDQSLSESCDRYEASFGAKVLREKAPSQTRFVTSAKLSSMLSTYGQMLVENQNADLTINDIDEEEALSSEIVLSGFLSKDDAQTEATKIYRMLESKRYDVTYVAIEQQPSGDFNAQIKVTCCKY